MTTHTDASISLKTGDRMSREGHRRYVLRPDIHRAELIDGVVYVPSPLRGDYHGEPHGLVMHWLGHYCLSVPGLRCMDSTTLLLGGEVEVQPDAMLWHTEPGGPHLNDDGYVEGAPQLVVEVSATTVSYDLHQKKEAYRRNGVVEYVVWRVLDRAVDWFRLQDGEYLKIEPDADGTIESAQFPGLRLHVQSMLAGDMKAVLARMP